MLNRFYSRYREFDHEWVVAETENKKIWARCKEKACAEILVSVLNEFLLPGEDPVVLNLSARDAEMVVEALTREPQLSPALIEAAERYKEAVRSGQLVTDAFSSPLWTEADEVDLRAAERGDWEQAEAINWLSQRLREFVGSK